jgi:phosphomethylpyrimidine synthase
LATSNILRDARAGRLSAPIRAAARAEKIPPKRLCEQIAAGRAVIPANKRRRGKRPYIAVGEGLRVKVNANLGTSSDHAKLGDELAKLRAAECAGADAVMDLSTGGDIRRIRRGLLRRTGLAFGTVPVYEAAVAAARAGRLATGFTADELFEVIRRHGEDGVDFITVHAGINIDALEALAKRPRVGGVVSRGGTLISAWMERARRENPLFEQYDRLVELAREFDMVLSLGDALRPGALADAGDEAQFEELRTLARLARAAIDAGVQVMIEGPGHVPLHEIVGQMRLEKELTGGVPFYVLGPLVTDVAPGYDHITSAIGGALAATCGADFLCYVTPAEHLRLPGPEEVRQGVIASRIAAHAGDVARGVPGAAEWDERFSRMRARRDWEGMTREALDPRAVRRGHEISRSAHDQSCTMCGSLCVFRIKEKEREAGAGGKSGGNGRKRRRKTPGKRARKTRSRGR